MVTTQENCYQGVDRSVLLDLKKIYEELQIKMNESLLGEIESDVYYKLKDLFTNFIYRPFFQGDNKYTVENEIAKDFFVATVAAVRKFLILNASTINIEARNLDFRLERIIDGDRRVPIQHEEHEFADGHVVDIRDMRESDYARAAQEFSEGSRALENFLRYSYADKMYTKACCKGHECVNESVSSSYIAFDFGEEDAKKEYLISKAFENNIEFVLINFNTGLGFDLLINPYELEEKVELLQKALEVYRGDEVINPLISSVVNYAKATVPIIGDRYFAIRCGKSNDGKVIYEETEGKKSFIGVFEPEEIESMMHRTPLEPLEIEVLEPPETRARDVARSALNLTKQLPGKFAESMRNMLDVVKKMIGRDDREDRDSK